MDSDCQKIVIRAAVPEDAAAIQAMIAALALETIGDRQAVLSVDAVRRFGFGAEKSFECIVGHRAGEIVGAVIMYDEFSTWSGQKGIYILDIYIAPCARGRGIGRRLIAEVAKWGGSRGASYVRLSVDQDNLRAVSFYEMIGFKERAHDRVFVLSGDELTAIQGG